MDIAGSAGILPGMQRSDVIVVGAGILGVSFAAALLARGRKVVLIERHSQPGDGSVRNFGLAWPFVMPGPEWVPDHLRTAEIYSELARTLSFDHQKHGALLVAQSPAEIRVMEEFAAMTGDWQIEAEMLPAHAARSKQRLLGATTLGALHFPGAAAVNPRRLVAAWLEQLRAQATAVIRSATTAVWLEAKSGGHRILTSAGEWFEADRVVLCSGEDFQTLLPEVLRTSGLVRCKLQMLETEALDAAGPSLAFGRSLRHYPLFSKCPGFSALRSSSADEELDRFGIHLLLKPTSEGTLVIGDSHEDQEGEAPRDFDYSARIENRLLELASAVLDVPRGNLAPRRRWLGYYSRHATRACFEAEPQPGVHVFSGLTCGMSAGPGFAERRTREW
jgi:FAD dependent oxidoreductase TIGR03364